MVVFLFFFWSSTDSQSSRRFLYVISEGSTVHLWSEIQLWADNLSQTFLYLEKRLQREHPMCHLNDLSENLGLADWSSSRFHELACQSVNPFQVFIHVCPVIHLTSMWWCNTLDSSWARVQQSETPNQWQGRPIDKNILNDLAAKVSMNIKFTDH